jgi:hypothetical protein
MTSSHSQKTYILLKNQKSENPSNKSKQVDTNLIQNRSARKDVITWSHEKCVFRVTTYVLGVFYTSRVVKLQ